MKRISGLTVQAPSRPGVLGQIYRAMEEGDIALDAVIAPDAGYSGIIHLIPHDMEGARAIINTLGFPFSLEESFLITLPDGDESFGNLLHHLALSRLNIRFLFTLDHRTVLFATNDMDATEAILSGFAGSQPPPKEEK